MATADYFIDRALDSFNKGFTTMKAKKDALLFLNRAYEIHIKSIKDLCLAQPREERTQEHKDLYWDLPLDLYQWRPKHSDMTIKIFPGMTPIIRQIEDLATLRQTIKDTPIMKIERKGSPLEEKITKEIHDIIARRETQYARGLQFLDIFKTLPVHINAHWVINQYGSRFIRCFYFLDGKLTPLSIILALLQEKEERERKGDSSAK